MSVTPMWASVSSGEGKTKALISLKGATWESTQLVSS